MSLFPVRECRSCGAKTASTSTIDHCMKCGDSDGLRPKHFLTRDKRLGREHIDADGFFRCEFCRCVTNAFMRRCCSEGTEADRTVLSNTNTQGAK